MHIKKCIASYPGVFQNRSIGIDNGITVIHGKNNTGKTLLSRAIIDTLFPLTSEPLLDNQSWQSLSIEVDTRIDNATYRFTRNGASDISINTVNDRGNIQHSHIVERKYPPGSVLHDDLGSKNGFLKLADFYRNLGYHGFIAAGYLPSAVDLDRLPPVSRDAIEFLLLQDRSNYYASYRAIKESFSADDISARVHNELSNEIFRYERLKKDTSKKIELLKINASKREKQQKEQEKQQEDIKSLSSRIDAFTIKKNHINRILQAFARKRSLEEEIQQLEQRIESGMEQEKDIRAREKELEKSYPQFKNFDITMKSNIKHMQDTYREIRGVNDKLEKELFQREHRVNKLGKIISAVNLGILALVVWLFFKGSAALKREDKVIVIGGMIVVYLLSYIIYIIYRYRLFRSPVLQRYESEKEVLEQKLEGILQANDIDLADIQLDEIYEFLLQYFEEYGEFNEKQLDLYKLKKIHSEQFYNNDLYEKKEALEADLKSLTGTIQEMAGIAGIQHDDLEDEKALQALLNETRETIDSLTSEMRSRQKVADNITANLAESPDMANEMHDLEEQLREYNTVMDSLTKRKRHVEYLLELFEESIHARMQEQMERLVHTTASIFRDITGGSYPQPIGMDTIISVLGKKEHDSSHNVSFSHLLQLAIKCALHDFLVDSGVSIPLILDDPFVFLDNDNIDTFRNILEKTAESRQIILFTHSDALNKWYTPVEL